MIKFCVVLLGLLALSGAHSWMTCPPSYNSRSNRGGNKRGPCDGSGSLTEAKAGDRLKVGWTSNNHAGGWVRLALVPHGKHKAHKNFEQNVLKVACYGHDETKARSTDCKHPCNGRQGCEYQADKYDVHRYDTTVKIPYNLPDGIYVLQWISAMGAHPWFYYSCARLQISGGNPSLSCKQTEPGPVAYGCLEGTGMPLEKYNNNKMGDFCFAEDGLGDQDADIRTNVPVNADCDHRATCELSVNKPACLSADNKMQDIRGGKQVCKGEIVPPPEPTCEDGVRNQGEEMADCGGPVCIDCSEVPTEPVDNRVYTAMVYQENADMDQALISIRMGLRIIKAVENWTFTIFLTEPVVFEKASINYWGCRLISHNEFNTVWTFGPEAWNGRLGVGRTLHLGFNGEIENLDAEPPQTVTRSFEEA